MIPVLYTYLDTFWRSNYSITQQLRQFFDLQGVKLNKKTLCLTKIGCFFHLSAHSFSRFLCFPQSFQLFCSLYVDILLQIRRNVIHVHNFRHMPQRGGTSQSSVHALCTHHQKIVFATSGQIKFSETRKTKRGVKFCFISFSAYQIPFSNTYHMNQIKGNCPVACHVTFNSESVTPVRFQD